MKAGLVSVDDVVVVAVVNIILVSLIHSKHINDTGYKMKPEQVLPSKIVTV